MSLFITLILLEINRMPYKDPIELYQSRVGAATQLDLDTMATYEWNSYQISFLKDSLKNTSLLCRSRPYDRSLSAGSRRSTGERSLLAGKHKAEE